MKLTSSLTAADSLGNMSLGMSPPASPSAKPASPLPPRRLPGVTSSSSTTSSTANAASNAGATGSSPRLTAAARPLLRTSTSGRPLSKRDQLMVVTQLSIMLRSGVDLADAVRSVALRSSSPTIRDAMGEVYSALESGSRLSQALESQSHRFGGVMVASVAAGEASGRLPEVLARLSVIIRDEMRLRSAIKSAISYPLVLTLVTMLVLAAMIFFVLPQFAGIYAASRAPTPVVTQLMLDGAAWARSYWWLLSGAFAVGVGMSYRYLRSPWGKKSIDRMFLRLRLLRTICTSLIAGRMFRLQGVMLESGVPMLEVLQLTRQSVGNHCFAELIDAIRESIVNGQGIASVMHDNPCIPEGAAEMIATAEQNGQLGAVLQTVGEFYESEGEQLLRDAIKFAEPAIIVVLGLVVGGIVLAVMLPMLDLSTAGGAWRTPNEHAVRTFSPTSRRANR